MGRSMWSVSSCRSGKGAACSEGMRRSRPQSRSKGAVRSGQMVLGLCRIKGGRRSRSAEKRAWTRWDGRTGWICW